MLLLTVEDKFKIEKRGIVLIPGVGKLVEEIEIGSKVLLIKPDKTKLEARIGGIIYKNDFPIMINGSLEKGDIPKGTEVWLG